MDSPTQAAGTKRLVTLGGLAGLLLLALVLRAWGLSWGLPSAARHYPYHPDESALLNAVCQVNPLWMDFAPSFYNYGSFYILLTRIVYDFTAPILGWGSVPRFDLPFESWVNDFARLLVVGRWVSVAMGVGTVLTLFALGRRLFGVRTGWLAAAFLAVAPLPVLLGHYLAVDVPSTFLVTLALLFGATAIHETDGRRAMRWLVGAAFVGGLAVGAKYNTVPVLVALTAPIWQLRHKDQDGRRLALFASAACALAAALAFLLATPGSLLETKQFVIDVLYEMDRSKSGQGLIFISTPPALVYHLGNSLPIGLEWPLYLLAIGGVAWSIKKRRIQDVYLWLFIAPFFLMLMVSERKFIRYITPLIPILLVLAARVAHEGLTSPRRRIWAAGAAVSGAAALVSTVAHLGVLAAPDARDQAAEYLRRHATPAHTVALASDAWFYTPPIHPTAGAVKIAQAYGGPPIWDLQFAMGQPREEITTLPEFKVMAPRSVLTRELLTPAGALSVERLRARRPEWVVITDYEYEDPERIRRAEPTFADGRLDLLAALDQDYRLEREFRPRPSLAGFTWWSSGIPPHDWRYYMPTVRIYRLGKTSSQSRPAGRQPAASI